MARQDRAALYRLRSSDMGTTTKSTLGPRLIAAVIPSRVKNLSQLQLMLGVAYTTVHRWSTGDSTPDWESVEALAEQLHVDVIDLLRGDTAAKPRMRDHGEWTAAVERARQKWPGRLSDAAIALAGETVVGTLPEHLDEGLVFDLVTLMDRYFAEKSSAA